jgi:hypothetical protein
MTALAGAKLAAAPHRSLEVYGVGDLPSRLLYDGPISERDYRLTQLEALPWIST